MGKVDIYGILDLALEPSSHCLMNNKSKNKQKNRLDLEHFELAHTARSSWEDRKKLENTSVN